MKKTLDQEIEAISEQLEKASGLGSRGGEVIRYTRSGKPIYASSGDDEAEGKDGKKLQETNVAVKTPGKERKNLQALSNKKSKQRAAKLKAKEAMKKSEEDTVKDTLKGIVEKIKVMGPEGLKKATENLTTEQKDLLGKILAKAKSPSLQAEAVLEPKNIKDLNSHEVPKQNEGRNDAQDEKLVKPENDEHKHQGDNSPEGFESQKIEDKESEKGSAPADEKPMDSKPGDESSKMNAEEKANFERTSQMKKALKKAMKKAIKKALKKEAMKPEVEGAQDEYGAKDPKKFYEKPEAKAEEASKEPKEEKKEANPFKKPAFKKSEEVSGNIQRSDANRSNDDSVEGTKMNKFEEIFKSEEKMADLCKNMIKKGKSKKAWMDKCGMMGKDMKKCEQAWDNAESSLKRMSKSITWNDWTADALGNSAKRGQNHRYTSSNDEIEKQEKQTAEVFKKGAYVNEYTQEAFKKSEGSKKVSINDLIENKLDVSMDQAHQVNANLQFKKSFAPRLTASFTQDEICKSLGIDAKKAEEILGKK